MITPDGGAAALAARERHRFYALPRASSARVAAPGEAREARAAMGFSRRDALSRASTRQATRMVEPAGAKALLDALAREARAAGSAGEARARAMCADRLRAAGFDVREESFEYSAFPGTRAAIALGAVALAMGMAVALGGPAFALHAVPLGLLALGGMTIYFEQAVLTSPSLRRTSTNLVATRGRPALWLCAHLDSKSQPLSMRGRIFAVTAVAAGVALMLSLWLAAFFGRLAPFAAWRLAGVVTAAGAIALVCCTVGDDSPGAVDNASGLAAVLLAVEDAREPVGVVLTSAEELGLAGARAWAAAHEERHVREAEAGRAATRGDVVLSPRVPPGLPPPPVVMNVDSIDDRGVLRCIVHRAPDAPLAARVSECAAAAGVPLRRSRMPFGVLMDSLVFARRGWRTVGISRVDWDTLSRIHRPTDVADRCNGTGIAGTARVLAECVRRIA